MKTIGNGPDPQVIANGQPYPTGAYVYYLQFKENENLFLGENNTPVEKDLALTFNDATSVKRWESNHSDYQAVLEYYRIVEA